MIAIDPVIPRVWITKYALTKGVFTLDNVKHCTSINAAMITKGVYDAYHGNDWHRTEAAALVRAAEMRLAKIASLKKQIAKLEKMTFVVRAGREG